MNTRQLFKAVGVGFVLALSALPVSSDYHRGTRANGSPSNGYYIDRTLALVGLSGYAIAIEAAAQRWRDVGVTRVTNALVRRNTLPAGNITYDRWYSRTVQQARANDVPLRVFGETIPNTVPLPPNPTQNQIYAANWGYCQI